MSQMDCKGDAGDRLDGGGGGRFRQSKGEDAREAAAAEAGGDPLTEAKSDDFSGVAEEKRSPCALRQG